MYGGLSNKRGLSKSSSKPLPLSMLVGGTFTRTDSNLDFVSNFYISDLSGNVDPTSKKIAFDSFINQIVVQNDNKILIVGGFSNFSGTSVGRIVRLNSDYSIDTTFNSGLAGANNTIQTVVVQSDGKILIGGLFTSYNGVTINRIARLNTDGTLDNSFNVGAGLNNSVHCIKLQSNSKIIVVGLFTTYNNVTVKNVFRLNSDGSLDTSFDAGTSSGAASGSFINVCDIQNDDKIIIALTSGVARLNNDGSLDTTFGTNGVSVSSGSTRLVYLQPDGKVLFSPSNIYNGRRLWRLNSDGTIDSSFSGPSTGVWGSAAIIDNKIFVGTNDNAGSGAVGELACLNYDGSVNTSYNLPSNNKSVLVGAGSTVAKVHSFRAIALHNNKLLIGGLYGIINAGTSQSSYVAINSNNTRSYSYSSSLSSTAINSIAMQSDKKILIGGTFTNNILRLQSNGNIDTSFNIGTGFNNTVNSIVVQNDNKILIGGTFTTYNGATANRIVRLNTDGTVDASFITGTGFNNSINNILIQNDGKIYIGGSFSAYNGTNQNYIIRLNTNGTIDSSFNIGTGFNNSVTFMAIQNNGQIVMGGNFTTYNGVTANRLIRLNSDGSRDNSFSTGTTLTGTVNSINILSNNKILVAGSIAGYSNMARFNSDGTIDNSFSSNVANNVINSAIVQSDNKIIIGGTFTSVNNNPGYKFFARINEDGILDKDFMFDVSNLVKIIVPVN